jgi:hypothetical protein
MAATMTLITTVKDLNKLPVGSILVDHQDGTVEVSHGTWRADAWQKVDATKYWRGGDSRDFDAAYVSHRGPLLVLWAPRHSGTEGN